MKRIIKTSLMVILLSLVLPGLAQAAKVDINSASEQALYDVIAYNTYTKKKKKVNTSYCRKYAKNIVAKRPHASVASLKSKKVISASLYNKVKSYLTASAVSGGDDTNSDDDSGLPFPKTKDLTSKQSPARDQGRRGTCVAFSTIAGLEFYNKSLDLSEQHAYYRMREGTWRKSTCMKVKYDSAKPKICQDNGCYGTNLSTAVTELRKGVLSEKDWAYERLNNTAAGVNCHEMITWASKAPSMTGKKLVKLKSVEWLASPGQSPVSKRVDDPMVLMAILAQGYAVNITIGVAGSGWSSGKKIDVEIDPATKKPVAIRGGHGLLLVGYDYDKQLFKFKNSWGGSWGSSGFGWFTFDYLKTYVTGGYYATGILQ